ncbi:uncharacterized protein LOC134816503 isoform X1 [Bolinopsis microptera]|uniref:uncharacterized protein LOC134816503 isoform X1 n=1 Tax=Bolinopsis microptera TaxID=2820187 RepID=UPI0030793705
MADIFSQEQMDKFRVIFEQFDKNGDGDISAKELKGALKQLGQVTDTKSCKKMIKAYDKNRTKRMEFKEFLDMMANVFQYHLSHPEVAKDPANAEKQRKQGQTNSSAREVATNKRLEDLFDSLDGDESGFIDAEEIIKLTEKLGEKMSLEEVQELIGQVDKDGDGRVNKDEFKRLMASK